MRNQTLQKFSQQININLRLKTKNLVIMKVQEFTKKSLTKKIKIYQRKNKVIKQIRIKKFDQIKKINNQF